MAQLKAGEVDRFLKGDIGPARVFLVYGPDLGLVSERADKLCEKSEVDKSDPFSNIRLDADLVAGETGRLADEAGTISMFGGERLIRISGHTRRDLAKAVKPVLDNPPSDCRIVIEAGDLKKSAPLRKLVEASPHGLTLPCYQDNAAAIEQLIREEIDDKGLKLDADARAYLKSCLGADRRASRNELQKLALYAHGLEIVSVTQVREVVGDVSESLVDDLVDTVCVGDLRQAQHLLPKVLEAGTSPDMVMIFALRHLQGLHRARSAMERERKSAVAAMSAMRPPVHFSRKDKVAIALSALSGDRLIRLMKRLDQASLSARKNPMMAASLASTALMAVALEARAGQVR